MKFILSTSVFVLFVLFFVATPSHAMPCGVACGGKEKPGAKGSVAGAGAGTGAESGSGSGASAKKGAKGSGSSSQQSAY